MGQRTRLPGCTRQSRRSGGRLGGPAPGPAGKAGPAAREFSTIGQREGAYLAAPRGLEVACGFNKVERALEILEEVKAAGEKAIVFTSLRGLYRTLEVALKNRFIGYVGIDGVDTRRRNDAVRRFEASDATVLLAGTGTLNRGVTVNGANHVLILNLEWSPETTLQAEDRCHRPGQTREVHVHYLLSSQTVDEQM